MSSNLGSKSHPLRVAIVGAGPSGFYAAGGLLQQTDIVVTVDMFDRLPAPYGLVRYGVAPDHQKIKAVTKVFDRTASDQRFRFFGNVDFGNDISHSELKQHYDQIVYAVGAQSDRRLNIPGEDLRNSLSATEFVAWYNGHPFFSDIDIDLDCESVVVVGVGNVAADVARILAKSEAELQSTDIADYALQRLKDSKVRDIYVLARRGPAQAKFTNPELKELGELEIADLVISPESLVLDPVSQEAVNNDPGVQRNMATMTMYANRESSGKERRIHLRFLASPVEILSDDGQRIASVRIERNELRADDTGYLNAVGTGEYETLPACMVLRSVGYRGIPLDNVPYDKRRGVIPNRDGRVTNPETDLPVPGEYVVGWAKRGPSGVIGTNKPDALETVRAMLEDIPTTVPAPVPDPAAITVLLQERGRRFVTIGEWRVLDRMEIEAGAATGRPRVKFTQIREMLDVLDAARAEPVRGAR